MRIGWKEKEKGGILEGVEGGDEGGGGERGWGGGRGADVEFGVM